MQLFFKTLLLKIDPLFGGAFDGHGGRGWGMDVTRLEPLAELVSDSAHLPIECIKKGKGSEQTHYNTC